MNLDLLALKKEMGIDLEKLMRFQVRKFLSEVIAEPEILSWVLDEFEKFKEENKQASHE